MLPNVNKITLNHNLLTGIIPNNISDSILSKSKLTLLDISHNKLSGSFPENFANLNNLSKCFV